MRKGPKNLLNINASVHVRNLPRNSFTAWNYFVNRHAERMHCVGIYPATANPVLATPSESVWIASVRLCVFVCMCACANVDQCAIPNLISFKVGRHAAQTRAQVTRQAKKITPSKTIQVIWQKANVAVVTLIFRPVFRDQLCLRNTMSVDLLSVDIVCPYCPSNLWLLVNLGKKQHRENSSTKVLSEPEPFSASQSNTKESTQNPCCWLIFEHTTPDENSEELHQIDRPRLQMESLWFVHTAPTKYLCNVLSGKST